MLRSEAEVLGMSALPSRRGCFRIFTYITRKRDVDTVLGTVRSRGRKKGRGFKRITSLLASGLSTRILQLQ